MEELPNHAERCEELLEVTRQLEDDEAALLTTRSPINYEEPLGERSHS